MKILSEVTPYEDQTTPKQDQVGKMFDHIAPKYDLMNSVMTFGLHRVWRNRALKSMDIHTEHRLLDIATGTGDLIFHAEKYAPRQMLGADISEGMLKIARERLKMRKIDSSCSIEFIKSDCRAIPCEDASFDRITVAYGVRNFPDLPDAYREMYRLLAPGGRVCILELCEPTNPLVRSIYKLYTRLIIPRVGRCISGDSRAYTYLPESISACPQGDDMARLIQDAGFSKVRYRTYFPGTVKLYTGAKD